MRAARCPRKSCTAHISPVRTTCGLISGGPNTQARRGSRSPSRISSRHAAWRRLRARRSLRGTCRRTTRRWLSVARRGGSRCWGRRTWTSSRWALRPRTRRTGRRSTPGTCRAFRADRRAARRPRSPPGSHPGRSAPTRAARSSSPPLSAASSACDRRTARSPATASSRSPRASTRSAHLRRPCATAPSSTR